MLGKWTQKLPHIFIILAGFLVLTPTTKASTAAFGGEVIRVEDCPSNQKDCLRQFTVDIQYFDYISWSKFGRHSKIGETITRRVKKVGTVCLINGRLVNAKTFAAAIRPGTWGYFYEDTWLDLQTTPDFLWGEVLQHDPAKKQFTYRLDYTHMDYHAKTNPSKEIPVKYEASTKFRIEEKASSPQDALKAGYWVQVHNPRPQMVDVRTPESAFNPKELLPAEEGKRGYANDLSAPAILKSYQSKNPDGVQDVSVNLSVLRLRGGKWDDVSFQSRKLTFILDGKACPVNIGFRPGRHAVLGHYRSEKSPHKIFVRSFQDTIEGKIFEVAQDGSSVKVALSGIGSKPLQKTINLNPKAQFWLDGQEATASEALQVGRDIVVYPERGRTIIAFPPYEPTK